ncbi:MAG TPA: restriction endonuclease [Chthoniobacterales bacterium]
MRLGYLKQYQDCISALAEFSPDLSQLFGWWYGEIVTPGDVPLRENGKVIFPAVSQPDSYIEQSNRLLNEALANKQRVIPTGAIVQQPFGSLRSFEIHEVDNRIGFVARNERGEFGLAYFSRHDDRVWRFDCENCIFVDHSEPRLKTETIVALRYVLALIVRDFWVLDQRDLARVFANQNPKRVPGIRVSKMPDGSPRIVYLPRIVYTGVIPTCTTTKLDDHLHLTKRAIHLVREHRRLSSSRTERARLLAERYGMPIEPGYTFVSPHIRGEQSSEVIYRSRSALACLYRLQPGAANENGLQGLEFQWQVTEALKRSGHQTLVLRNHIGGPDGGVDIHTIKDDVRWAFQVKQKRPGNKVDIDEIRIFSDALRDLPEGIHPIFVTNSTYTKPARDLARARGIILWDQYEIERLLNH